MSLSLEDIKVIEIAGAAAVPMTGRLLSDWGADVVRIEHPATGDAMRHVQASAKLAGTIGNGATTVALSDIPYEALNYNRNKRSMTLNLSMGRGQKIMHKMIEKADVLLSNMRPYEMEKWQLEYEMLSRKNSKLIYASLNGYGHKGADRNAPGYDSVAAWARTGMQDLVQASGFRPALIDNVAGMALAYGVMTALFMRERTGMGQEVCLSLYQTGVFQTSFDIAGALVTGENYDDWGITSREELPNVLAATYKTKDGRTIRLGILQPDRYWSKFCEGIGRNDLVNDQRFSSFSARIDNNIELLKIVDGIFLSKTLDEWRPCLDEVGIPWAPVQTLQEVVNDPQARANDFFSTLDHPTFGQVEVVANPIKLSKAITTIKPAPEFGQHTEEVLRENGYTWDDIEQLKNENVIS